MIFNELLGDVVNSQKQSRISHMRLFEISHAKKSKKRATVFLKQIVFEDAESE
jgi:hypothetical protein